MNGRPFASWLLPGLERMAAVTAAAFVDGVSCFLFPSPLQIWGQTPAPLTETLLRPLLKHSSPGFQSSFHCVNNVNLIQLPKHDLSSQFSLRLCSLELVHLKWNCSSKSHWITVDLSLVLQYSSVCCWSCGSAGFSVKCLQNDRAVCGAISIKLNWMGCLCCLSLSGL